MARARIPWTCRGCAVTLTQPDGAEIEVTETNGPSGGGFDPYTRVQLDGRDVHDCEDPSVVPVEFTFQDTLGGYPGLQFDPVQAPFATTSDTRFARRWSTEDEARAAATRANLGTFDVIAVPFL
jgi:hypothetical protein